MGPEVMNKVDINKVVDTAVAFLKYQMEQENIQLQVEKQAGLQFIQGNANELEQVFTNLILNAKDAIKQKGQEGVIKLQTAQKSDTVSVKVTDNGIGIPKENLKKIFDPFFTTKEMGKGTGLGLAVTYGIVEKHKGRIEVTSASGEGAAFMVILPKEL